MTTPSTLPVQEPAGALSNPGGIEVSALLDSILSEYGWPSNPKNAARAGWTAAMRYIAPLPPVTQAKSEAVAWCQLTKAGTIAYFDGKPMVMPGTVGNDCHPDPLYTAPREAVERQPLTGWQPIETAPQTGRTILLGYFNALGKWRTLRGQWFSREIIDEEWENAEDCEEGWYETPVEGEEYLHRTQPTHWQPLPEPPGIGPATQEKQHG